MLEFCGDEINVDIKIDNDTVTLAASCYRDCFCYGKDETSLSAVSFLERIGFTREKLLAYAELVNKV